MSKSYPGYPPNCTDLTTIGGMSRTCFVIDVLSLGSLSAADRSIILEHLEAAVESLKVKSSVIECIDIVQPERFDPQLRTGLRIK